MKKKFVIDENVLYHAFRGVDERNNEDTSSTEFIEQLVKNCHKFIYEKRIIEKYQQILTKLKRDPEYPIANFALLANDFFRNQEKWILVENEVPELEGIELDSNEDTFLVEIARHMNCPIITNDGTLKTELDEHTELDIEVIKPEDAIDLVSNP